MTDISYRLFLVFSWLASFIGFFCFLPIIAFACLLVYFEDKENPFFVQERVGRNRKLFKCYKVRSMKLSTPNVPSHTLVSDNITSVGKFIRKYKVDELPQLWNVVIGDMTLVGPRPCLASQYDVVKLREEAGVLEFFPGITGYSQVNSVDMSDVIKLVGFDKHYCNNRGFMFDLTILMKTVLGRGFNDPANN